MGYMLFLEMIKKWHGSISKPTGKKDERVIVNGNYGIHWRACGDMKYYTVKMTD